jgi:hypothetical protein
LFGWLLRTPCLASIPCPAVVDLAATPPSSHHTIEWDVKQAAKAVSSEIIYTFNLIVKERRVK